MNPKNIINKTRYFSHRLDMIRYDERDALGDREVITLMTVLDWADGQTSLSGVNVADLGCGDKYLKAPFEIRGASYRGVDIEECNLETETIPLDEESQDIVMSLSVIEHLHDPGHFLSEIKRILKPGGALWMCTPDIEACGANFWNDPTHVHPYTRSSLKTLLDMHGFVDVLVTPNYRCKPKSYYSGSDFSFFRARRLMPFSGTSKSLVPGFLKGGCTGLFSLCRKSVGHHM
jgi:2-polyprenyl-3-methyl-5-hydroxy-6-metoxy-1,4-benzoquinol methylase